MEHLVDVGLRNALLAIPLALMVLVLGFVVRRPALLHLLWILVLLRLLMPPLWHVTVPRPEAWVAPGSSVPMTVRTALVELPTPIEVGQQLAVWPLFDNEEAKPVVPEPEVSEPEGAAGQVVATAERVEPIALHEPAVRSWSWRWMVAVVWLTGSLVIVVLTAVRLLRFVLALESARPASATLQGEAEVIAAKLGMTRAPPVMLVDASISPMIWGLFGRPCLILPSELWERLEGSQQAALLAHELAHCRRGDHLVRWLELIAGALFWWHPVMWLARYRLREAEEQCCDAWVVWALPELRRDYATAIVDTVEFLSENRSKLPALASGVGRVHHLQRRLTMIMQGTISRRLPRLVAAALLGCGLALGALTPVWGDSQPTDTPPERRDEERRQARPDRPDRDREREETPPRAEDREREALRAELQRARQEFERARQRLEELERRVRSRETEPPRRGEEDPSRDVERPRDQPRPVRPMGGGGPPRPEEDRPFPVGGSPAERRLEVLEVQMQEMVRALEQIRRELRREGLRQPRITPGGPGGGRELDVPAPPAPPVREKPPIPIRDRDDREPPVRDKDNRKR